MCPCSSSSLFSSLLPISSLILLWEEGVSPPHRIPGQEAFSHSSSSSSSPRRSDLLFLPPCHLFSRWVSKVSFRLSSSLSSRPFFSTERNGSRNRLENEADKGRERRGSRGREIKCESRPHGRLVACLLGWLAWLGKRKEGRKEEKEGNRELTTGPK